MPYAQTGDRERECPQIIGVWSPHLELASGTCRVVSLSVPWTRCAPHCQGRRHAVCATCDRVWDWMLWTCGVAVPQLCALACCVCNPAQAECTSSYTRYGMKVCA
jgi:hypothetical protein